jgi:hypothetical protein
MRTVSSSSSNDPSERHHWNFLISCPANAMRVSRIYVRRSETPRGRILSPKPPPWRLDLLLHKHGRVPVPAGRPSREGVCFRVDRDKGDEVGIVVGQPDVEPERDQLASTNQWARQAG